MSCVWKFRRSRYPYKTAEEREEFEEDLDEITEEENGDEFEEDY